ncbi:MAG: PilZ domain-containing protein [Candidatus Omnitrophica bacterium]|nr:PilZ domain-containing protein [Candidatus Omnitrophota bacterium]
MTERRKFMRFNVLLDVLHTAFDGRDAKVPMRSKDISKDGVRLSGYNPLPQGSRIELEMKIPGDNMPIIASGEIAWTAHVGETNYDYGVRFTKIENYDRARLLGYVYNEWIKTRKTSVI